MNALLKLWGASAEQLATDAGQVLGILLYLAVPLTLVAFVNTAQLICDWPNAAALSKPGPGTLLQLLPFCLHSSTTT